MLTDDGAGCFQPPPGGRGVALVDTYPFRERRRLMDPSRRHSCLLGVPRKLIPIPGGLVPSAQFPVGTDPASDMFNIYGSTIINNGDHMIREW